MEQGWIKVGAGLEKGGTRVGAAGLEQGWSKVEVGLDQVEARLD